ncbi:hypothetical protein ACFQH6_10935 [Halobacteriaceae archaeon GCM10025711]
MFFRRYVGLLRGLLMAVGLFLFYAGLNSVARLPPGPPESDGFIRGLAYMFALIVGVAGLLLVQVGYAIPAGTGRFRVGPLAGRSAGLRGGVAVLVYFVVAALMVYGIPAVVPAVTESMTYATGLFVLVIAGVLGTVLAVLFALGGLVIRASRRSDADDAQPTD